MPTEDSPSMQWKVHPKQIGLMLALGSFVFLVLIALALPPETVSSSSFSILLTIFGFLAGSGFTTWLSMTIYEYIRKQEQVREWKQEFAVERVRQIYGPIYDEMIQNQEALSQLGEVRWKEGLTFQSRYLSLLVPPTLLDMGSEFAGLREEYNDTLRDVHLDPIVLHETTEYLSSSGGSLEAIDSFVGCEGQYVLGAEHLAFQANYEMLLDRVRAAIEHSGGEGSVSDFEDHLKRAVQGNPEVQKMMAKRNRLETLTSEIIRELEAPIRDPYEV